MNTKTHKNTRLSKRAKLSLGAAALLLVGGAAGAIAVSATRPSIEMAPLNPIAIRSLTDGPPVITVKGRVAEIYGNKFVMADASGKALVDTGRSGEDTHLVTSGGPVTVQGRFDHGFIHASYLIGSDGKVVALRPKGPPHGPHDEDGPRGDHGRPGQAPPPPPPPPPVSAESDANPAAPVPVTPAK
jgi:hypothetical protein